MKIIAFYLPQYYPIDENNKWYGEGFTEWQNVAKAKPLFLGHYQPHIPSDLGFYDLRLNQVREKQALMAKQYGINAFCYWNYWFGDGKQLLDLPIWEAFHDKNIDLPFCLAWANHSWFKKTWIKNGKNELIAEQLYLGPKDYAKYFYTFLPIFKDKRYFKIGDKLFFAIWSPLASNEIAVFIETWRELAKKEGLPGFYFVGQDNDCRNIDIILSKGFDAVYDDNTLNIHHHLNLFTKAFLFFSRRVLKIPTVFKYKKAAKYMITNNSKRDDVVPVISPNWDHSPRSGKNGIILCDCKPKYFKDVLRKAISASREKDESKQLIIIKAWNEWGEGNHLEPDIKFGKGYLEAIKDVLMEYNDGENNKD